MITPSSATITMDWKAAMSEASKAPEASPKCWINVRVERYRGRRRWVIGSRAHGSEEGYAVAYSPAEAEAFAIAMARRLVRLAEEHAEEPRDQHDRAFEDRRSRSKGGGHE